MRRQRRRRALAWFVSAGLVVGSFVVGYKLTKRADGRVSTFPVNTERRESAMRLIDEAVRAKYEGRLKDALLAAADARRADPKVAGADLIAADIALAQRDPERSRQAAAQALQQGHNESAAKLLLALAETTSSRSTGGDRVRVLLEEAAEAEFSNPAIHYVWGDLLRITGREKEAQRKLLGSLHRQEPWMSSTIIAAKLQLASVEASRTGIRSGETGGKIAPTLAGDALVAIHGALRSGGDLRVPLQNLWASIAVHLKKDLLDDPVFDVPAAPPILEEARKAQPPPIPHGELSSANPAGR